MFYDNIINSLSGKLLVKMSYATHFLIRPKTPLLNTWSKEMAVSPFRMPKITQVEANQITVTVC